MSHPQPPQRQPTLNETARYARAVHTTALVALVACPVLILLPPRKLDLYTFALCGGTVYSANFLIRERTGQSIWQHVHRGRPQGVQVEQSKFEAGNLDRPLQTTRIERQDLKQTSVTEQVRDQREAWKLEREKEIQEDIEEGKGFGDMIMDQIWEVWSWGRQRDDEDVDEDD